jgi:hypothetical protein
MKKKENRLIPEDALCLFPFNYSYLLLPEEMNDEEMNFTHKSGKIDDLQNDNAKIEPFYKNISRC